MAKERFLYTGSEPLRVSLGGKSFSVAPSDVVEGSIFASFPHFATYTGPQRSIARVTPNLCVQLTDKVSKSKFTPALIVAPVDPTPPTLKELLELRKSDIYRHTQLILARGAMFNPTKVSLLEDLGYRTSKTEFIACLRDYYGLEGD